MIRREAPAAALAFAAALVTRLIPLAAHPFNGLYGQDAYTYYAMAEAMAGIRTYGGVYIWGVGYPALLASGFSVFGSGVGVAQGISILLGAALSPLIYALARLTEISRTSSLMSALIMALCGQAALSSVCIMSDIPALFWATVSAVCLFAYHRERRAAWLSISAALLMMAAITRWNYAILVPIWIGFWWASKERNFRDAVLALAAGLIVALPEVLFSFSRPSPVFFNFGSWDAGRIAQSQFVTSEGTFNFSQVNALFYAHPIFDTFWLSPVFGVMAGIGVLHKMFEGFRRDVSRPYKLSGKSTFLFFAAWLVMGYVFLCGLPQQSARYALILLPPLLIYAGFGFDWLWAHRTAAVRVGLGVVSMAGAISIAQAGYSGTTAFIATHESDKQVVRAVIAYLPEDITLYTFELTAALRFDAPFDVHDLYDETPASIAENLDHDGRTYLLIDTGKIRTRWAGMPIEGAFDALIRAYNMRRVGIFRQYTLFQAVIPLPRRS